MKIKEQLTLRWSVALKQRLFIITIVAFSLMILFIALKQNKNFISPDTIVMRNWMGNTEIVKIVEVNGKWVKCLYLAEVEKETLKKHKRQASKAEYLNYMEQESWENTETWTNVKIVKDTPGFIKHYQSLWQQ
jgi:hypothetical protein